jgi:hypothetical protein
VKAANRIVITSIMNRKAATIKNPVIKYTTAYIGDMLNNVNIHEIITPSTNPINMLFIGYF